VKGDDFAYYRLLVDTRIQYAARLLPPMKDTVTEMKALTDMLASKAKQYFIREINALHSVENEAVRFKRLEGLTPQELYYLVVMGEDEIYTSSYLNVYKRIFQRMSTPRSDSLFMSVNGDYFRKFLKMAAGYNTLNDFLGKMDKENATTTMKAFVIKLENTNGLEEAVDVADSYSSIMDKNPSLAKYILDEVKWNYTRNEQAENKRGMVIYNLLKTLFESADTLNAKKDLSAELGIPSIYSKDYQTLTDSSGRVIQQVFFYGDEDKDGQLSFENFMGMFRGMKTG
jgi:Ca2+-binding EF-hand superfamily protein